MQLMENPERAAMDGWCGSPVKGVGTSDSTGTVDRRNAKMEARLAGWFSAGGSTWITKDKPKLEKENVVSIWCGNFDTEEELLEYVEPEFDEDDNPTSEFMNDFSLDWYDEDFAEASFDPDDDIALRVREHSYGDSFDGRLNEDMRRFADCNSLYLIYDVGASGATSDRSKLTFVGAYPYRR